MAKTIGFIGGTGPEGKGLAVRFAHAGLEVIVGSRAAERGAEAAVEVASISGGSARGGSNADAASAEIVILTTPYAGMAETLSALTDELAGKILVSAVVPLQFSRARVAMLDLEDGSAAQEAQRLLPQTRVIGAFHNLSASHLLNLEHALEGDVIVCGDDKEALAEVIGLAGLIEGIRGVDAGPLANNQYVEGLTALLININRIHKAETHFRIVGI